MKKVLVLFLGILISLFCDAQERELLIIGTMHTVPESVKDSYRPLLDYALEYAPEAIYVEYIHPDDTLSINLYTPGFLEKSDSLRQSYHFDEKFFLELGDKRLTDLSKKDFEFLSQSYLRQITRITNI